MMIKKILVLLLFYILSNNIIAQTLEEKIGQMIMVGFSNNSSSIDTLYADIHQRNLGGVILFAHNIDSPEQLQALTNNLQSRTSLPIFIAIDQEGGLVARLDEQNGYQKTKTAFQLGTILNIEDSTRKEASQMATWLRDGGCNINFAPVVDVNINPNSPAIGAHERSFSDNPEDVYNNSFWFIDEFHKQNILTTLKHFPGHGSAINDSHLGFTDVTDTWNDKELIPYKKLINNGYSDIIMSAHIFNKNLDSLYPASLSFNTITNLLRDSLNFTGLVISDELLMRAITDEYSFEGAIELAINAGIDLLLYSTNIRNNKSLVRDVISIVKQKVASGKILESRIDDAYNRILLKKDFINSVKISKNNLALNHLFISNYPNPFTQLTTIEYSHGFNGYTKLVLYNSLGEIVTTILERNEYAGVYRVPFYPHNLSSGIYFLKVQVNQEIGLHKIIYIK